VRTFTISKSLSGFSAFDLRKALLLLVILSASVLLVSGQARALSPPAESNLVHPGGARPVAGLGQSSPQAKYDEQLGMTFGEGFSRLSYNVTAVAQSDAQGFGPGYLLNGLTNSGYWYQVGVAFNWPFQGGGYDAGFNFLYEAFNSTGASVYPSGGGGGLDNFSSMVMNGDLILLQLSFSHGQVEFHAHDWNTGADANQSFQASGSTFVGLGFSSGANGFFTGLMTEWYHASPYYGSEAEVTFSNSTTRLRSATLWVDEFNANTSTSLFGSSQTFVFSSPEQLRPLSLDGATEYADASTFITGSLGRTRITLSFSVVGRGGGFGAPLLSYIENGTLQTVALTGTPTTYLADAGSLWQVSTTLPGSTATERWETSQLTNGTLAAPVNESIPYFHQYLCTFTYSLSGGGSAPSPPQWNETSFGSPLSLRGNGSAWIDAGSSLLYSQVLAGSGVSVRWATQNYNLTITGPQEVHPVYYHQVALNLEYVVLGGGNTASPTLNGTRFGSQFSELASNSSARFLDAGTNWSLSSLLPGSGAQERWFASRGTNGSVVLPQSVKVTYEHQFALDVGVNSEVGGSLFPVSPWVTAGSSVQLNERPEGGWKFEGWTGSGSGSYSGPLANTSVIISGPVTENATFYPGLEISAGPNGEVFYSSTAANGTVPAGESTTIYTPIGSAVKLHAIPSSVFYSFAGWSPPEGGTTVSLALSAPGMILADFRLNPLPVIAVIFMFLIVAVGVSFYALRKKHSVGTPAFNPPSPGP